ncbi:LytTR family transcriptional regulator [Spirosoma sp. HMF4905]|uniref:LytTR family transcriptional regulator n=1 Tax=Spirosoma arboris TaxID=2682092 RepID=A0A7K1S3Z5_9BACT|nr:LytTR family DNA-binding domain-containing protein [Spirosoma arboris]MVM28435.1 LytTR family transcriptional regulator [Spirosoma arboris]
MKRLDAAQLQHKFDPEKVLYLVGDVNYFTVHLLTGKSLLTSRTLKWYSERWPEFMRVHKGSLVNPQHIHSCVVVSSIEAHLIMRNGARLSIGRRRISTVIRRLGISQAKYAGTATHEVKSEWDASAPAYTGVT